MKKAQRSQPEALEFDKLWTFVGRRQRKVWLWLAVERASRRIVALVLDCRGVATVWRCGPRYQCHCRYHYRPSGWSTRRSCLLIYHRPRLKGSGKTNIVEAINCSLRQRFGMVVCKSC